MNIGSPSPTTPRMSPSSLEALVDIVGWLMLAIVGISSFYPWNPSQPFASLLIHLPLLLIPLWISYEILMPEHMNIRADLLFIPPLFLLTLMIWAFKLARFRKIRQKLANLVPRE